MPGVAANMKVAFGRGRRHHLILTILLLFLVCPLASCGTGPPSPFERASRLYQEAADLELEGRHQEAIAKYQEIITAGLDQYLGSYESPTYAVTTVYHTWARELEAQGHFDQAIAKYQDLIAWNPNGGGQAVHGQDAQGGIFGTYIAWAESLEAQGDYCQAAGKFQMASDCVTTPFQWDSRTYYSTDTASVGDDCVCRCACELRDQGHYEAAIAEFATVSTSSDNYQAAQEAIPGCYYSWAMGLKDQNRNDEAVDKYVRILETYPKWPSAEKGNALLEKMTGPTLLASFRQMLAAERWEGTVWLYRALVASYPTGPETTEARRSLEQAVEALLANAAGGAYADLPGFSVVATPHSGLAEVYIRNACPNVLTVLFLGPQLEVMSILPDSRARSYLRSETTGPGWTPSAWESAVVRLEPGEYGILAMVSGSSDLRLYGTETFSSNASYTSWYYIVTTYVTR